MDEVCVKRIDRGAYRPSPTGLPEHGIGLVPVDGSLGDSSGEPDPLGKPDEHAWQERAQDWQERALCAQTDPEAFFPEKGGSTREAKRICTGCKVRAECLEYALAHDERFGIWGGLSERERRRLKRRAV